MIPLLIVGDAPTSGTGLGRITNDISSLVANKLNDIFRVATLGYGGITSRHLPHHHYTAEGMDGWIIPNLPEIWDDWAGKEHGVILFISDPSRLQWFSRPERSIELKKYPSLMHFFRKPPFQKWIYAPVDASGPNDRLSYGLAQNLLGFDRILAYGKFGEDVIRRTLGGDASDYLHLASLPHGIDTDVFYPRERSSARAFFFPITGAETMRGEKELVRPDEALIGIVCTNQFRKDFGLALEAVSILSRESPIRLWIHTDEVERIGGWSISDLLVDFGILDRTMISLGHLSDDALAKAYSACDVTMAPGAEGFGYPIAESLACGTPVVHGCYAGGADILPWQMQVNPVAFRYESIWACKRPVYDPYDWAKKAVELIGQRAQLDPRYDWKNNSAGWEKWFREGVKEE
jgi:glycosyltransferase involved in cell wall biosynthesis